MENIEKKAESYAEGKVNEVLTQAIAKAYIKGYQDGYRDCEANLPIDLSYDGTEYVDLGLPSGTLWTKDYIKDENRKVLYMPHGEANCRNLPTEEQWKELMKECRLEYDKFSNDALKVLKIVGPNGAILTFETTGIFRWDQREDTYESYMWLKDNSNESSLKKAIIINKYGERIDTCFCGYKLPVRLVRPK